MKKGNTSQHNGGNVYFRWWVYHFLNGQKFHCRKEKRLCIDIKKPRRNTIKTIQPRLETILIKTVFGDLFNIFFTSNPPPPLKNVSFIL